jgi:transposase
MKEAQVAMQILNIDHLGIVAGIIDEMELVEEVNKIVGIKTREILTPGQVMKAMILNGLGFLSAPLYLFDEFFVGKATEHLIGEGVLPSHLNDDKLGRELDKYYQVGTTKIFTTVAIKAAHKFQIESKSIHLDGTSMSVEGEDKKETEEIEQTNQERE